MENIKNAEHMITILPYFPPVRFYNWATQQQKKPRTQQKAQNKEERAEGHLIDLHGDLELHIRGLLTYFGKWNNTEGFSVVTQISITLNILKGTAGEKQIYFKECYLGYLQNLSLILCVIYKT